MKALKALNVSVSVFRGRIPWPFLPFKINIVPAAPDLELILFPLLYWPIMNAHTKQQQDKVFETDFIDSQKPHTHDTHLLALSHMCMHKLCVLHSGTVAIGRNSGDTGCEDILACVDLVAAPWRWETWTVMHPQCYVRISWHVLTLLQHHDCARPDPSCVHGSQGGQWAGREGPRPWGVGHLHPPTPLAHRATAFLRIHPLWSVYCSVAWLCVCVHMRAWICACGWVREELGRSRVSPSTEPPTSSDCIIFVFCGLWLALWWWVGAWHLSWQWFLCDDCGILILHVDTVIQAIALTIALYCCVSVCIASLIV